MKEMRRSYQTTFSNLEEGYKRLEAKSRERYTKNMSTWKIQAKDKLTKFQNALKQAVDDREYVERVLKEKLQSEKISNEKLSKEKEFIYGEKLAGDEEIEQKKQLL